MTKKVSLAIDPGYDRVGVAVFEGKALIHSECFETNKKLDFPARLAAVHARLTEIISTYKPTTLALETLFFSSNVKTAIKVAEARGVIELVAAQSGLTIHEYSPQAVKIAVTGYGNSDKTAVQRMIGKLLILDGKKRIDDEYDAIALGIAHTVRPLST